MIFQILTAIIRGHDETLLKKGPRGATWKTYAIPFNKDLGKKKKFKNIKDKKYAAKPILREVNVSISIFKIKYFHQKDAFLEARRSFIMGSIQRIVQRGKVSDSR